MEHKHMLSMDNISILAQGLELLDQINDEMYTRVTPPFFDHSVGSHFRHLLDAYDCFFRGIETGRIDYDRRERDALVERDRVSTMARVESTSSRLRSLSSSDELVSLEAKQDSSAWTYSAIGRELQFLLSHTVHHFAFIALILRLQGFSPAKEFGVAPSTRSYWSEKEALCAR
jgi:hypothetical protein